MPTVEEYTRLRRLGEFQQEMGDILKEQGAFISAQGEALLEDDMEEKDEKEDTEEGKEKTLSDKMKNAIVARIKKRKQESEDSSEGRDGPNMNFYYPGSYFKDFKATP